MSDHTIKYVIINEWENTGEDGTHQDLIPIYYDSFTDAQTELWDIAKELGVEFDDYENYFEAPVRKGQDRDYYYIQELTHG